jgi:hypothetical protein
MYEVTTIREAELFLAELDQASRPQDRADRARAERYWNSAASDAAVLEVLAGIAARAPLAAAQEERVAALLEALLDRHWDAAPPPGRGLPAELPPRLTELYRALGPGSRARYRLLQLLATHAKAELADWATCLVEDPPTELRGVLVAFAPLFRRRDFEPQYVFPRLLDALAHRRLAASVLDLANYTSEKGLVDRHPAADRRLRMIGLLGELTQGLARLEEQLGANPADASTLAESVEDSVALAVALCRALSLIGDRAAIGKLNQALELRHRRLRVEAAAALATLGEPAGRQALAGLASEPVVRQRVLAYASECDCLDLVDPQYLTEEARAEGDLALWLAQPAQVGIPPTRLEVVDRRELYWPGYEEQVTCFLIRYTYEFAGGGLSNVGIVGPLVHAFDDDLGDLAPDDIYAAFAGWHAQHEEIFDLPAETWNEAQRVESARLERRLRDAGYEYIRPVYLGSFFGEKTLVARATRDRVEGIGVVDLARVDWWSTSDKLRPLSPEVAHAMAKGRKLLRSFQP